MKALLKRLATMSVALIALCVHTVAQNEKSTKSVTDDSYGVVVTSHVEMISGEIRYLTVTPLLGYDNPFLIYGNDMDSVVEGEIFKARIYITASGSYILEIEAKDVSKTKEDTLFVRAIQIYLEFGIDNRMNENPGAPIEIIVHPDLD